MIVRSLRMRTGRLDCPLVTFGGEDQGRDMHLLDSSQQQA